MTGIFVVAIVFLGVIGIVAVDGYFSLEKRKIDAALRQQEIKDGVPPGTYSRPYKNKKAYKKAQEEYQRNKEVNEEQQKTKSEEEIRAELINGITNLQQRIDNIDTIMKSRQENKEKKNEN